MSISFTGLAAGTLAFTLALAWNDVAIRVVRNAAPDGHRGYQAALVYAIVATIIVVFIVAVYNYTHRALVKVGVMHTPDAGGGSPMLIHENLSVDDDCRSCARCAHCFPKPLVSLT